MIFNLRPRLSSRAALFAAVSFLAACDVSGSLEEEVILGDPIISAEPAIIAESPAEAAARASGSPRNPRKGVLTAGDIDDALNLRAFASYQRQAGRALKLPGTNIRKPALAQVVTPQGQPAPGVRVTLRKPGARTPFYDGYSGVDGMVTVFPAAFGQGAPDKVEMRVIADGAEPQSVTLHTGSRVKVAAHTDGDWQPDFLDLAFVVDTTGSMEDELAWLTKELKSIVRKAKRAAPGVDIRYGLVVYKAKDDVYSVHNFGFTKSPDVFRRWIGGEGAFGGAGSAEYVARALKSGVEMDWRRGKGERLLFQIGDEPPERNMTKTYLTAAAEASRKGIQVFNLAASGVDPELEFLMRQGALVSNGRYLFLTDDSGVGFGHAEPTISCYQVSRLNDLMVRVLRSELSGQRVEPGRGDVIRQVGSYRRGVCQD